jgi:hypothetical protein
MSQKRGCALVAQILLLAVPVVAGGPTFRPDGTIKGSSLAGWHVLGQAGWEARNGEVIGTPKDAAGGWLVLDRSYQDAAFYASFRSAAGAKTGILFRAEKTADGMKGIFVSLSEGDLGPYRVSLDAQGREVQRERLRPAGGQIRFAPPAAAEGASGPRSGGAGAPARGPMNPLTRWGVPADTILPVKPPSGELRAGDWNDVEIFIDANIVRAVLNEGSAVPGGVAEDEAGRYGPLALYVGGTGEVRFKGVAYKDAAIRSNPREQVSNRFRMQRLNDLFYAWSAAAADFNHDGKIDLVAGPYIYFGPDFTSSREIYGAHTYNASTEYAQDCWVQFAYDFTGDGWPDVLTTSHSGTTGAILYVNPKGEARRWDKYQVVTPVQTEITLLKDIDGDGKPELVYVGEGRVRYAKPDPAAPTKSWIVRTISPPLIASAHGVGAGDVNGDGRMDIVTAFGWFEQPPAGSTQEMWTFHPEAFGIWSRATPGGSVIGVYDVNGDGLNDVVTSLSAHGIGLAWFEQKRDAAGKISFAEHVIMGDFTTKNAGGVTFTQPHATAFADIDGDGIPDFIVGKRYWSHLDDYYDPDPYGAPVLYWYRTVRNPKAPGGAEFVPELIHNHSGGGSDVFALDLNGDGAIDLVTSTNRGTFIFWGKSKTAAATK